jgi:translation initiation factor 1A
MGKKLVRNEEEIKKSMTLPSENDVLGIVTNILGQGRVRVKCQDGSSRLCRIRGKMKRRRWVREDDVVLVSPWEFKSKERGDIFFRYTNNQARWLRENGLLKV